MAGHVAKCVNMGESLKHCSLCVTRAMQEHIFRAFGINAHMFPAHNLCCLSSLFVSVSGGPLIMHLLVVSSIRNAVVDVVQRCCCSSFEHTVFPVATKCAVVRSSIGRDQGLSQHPTDW